MALQTCQARLWSSGSRFSLMASLQHRMMCGWPSNYKRHILVFSSRQNGKQRTEKRSRVTLESYASTLGASLDLLYITLYVDISGTITVARLSSLSSGPLHRHAREAMVTKAVGLVDTAAKDTGGGVRRAGEIKDIWRNRPLFYNQPQKSSKHHNSRPSARASYL